MRSSRHPDPPQWDQASRVLVEPLVILDEQFCQPIHADQSDARNSRVVLRLAGESTRRDKDASLLGGRDQASQRSHLFWFRVGSGPRLHLHLHQRGLKPEGVPRSQDVDPTVGALWRRSSVIPEGPQDPSNEILCLIGVERRDLGTNELSRLSSEFVVERLSFDAGGYFRRLVVRSHTGRLVEQVRTELVLSRRGRDGQQASELVEESLR